MNNVVSQNDKISLYYFFDDYYMFANIYLQTSLINAIILPNEFTRGLLT